MVLIQTIFTGESAQALLTIKNGGFYGSKNALGESVESANMEDIDNENGENLEEEDFISENSNDSRPGFLSALGLHPAGKNGPAVRQTPEKKSSPLMYNRRGTVSSYTFCCINDCLKFFLVSTQQCWIFCLLLAMRIKLGVALLRSWPLGFVNNNLARTVFDNYFSVRCGDENIMTIF